MGFDPAWFYSTMAQTSAAIVGLIGALQLNHLADHVSHLRPIRAEADQSVETALKQLHNRLNWLGRLEPIWAEEQRQAEELLSHGQTRRESSVSNDWDGATSLTNPRIVDLASLVKQREGQLRVLRSEVAPAYVTPSGRFIPDEIDGYANRLQKLADLAAQENGLRNILMEDHRSLRKALGDYRILRASAVPRQSVWLFGLLGFLTVVGIFLPIVQLVTGIDGPALGELAIVTLFGTGITLLMIYFWYQIDSLRKIGQIQWPTVPNPNERWL